LYAEDSIDLLRSSGLDFEKHSTEGLEPGDFAEMLLSSGLVLMDNVTWITFHSAYDFGYLLAQLTAASLPESEQEFLEDLKMYFPNLYDIKYLMTSTDNLMGGLQNVANILKVKRIGSQHQAGSDSLLTGQVFFKIYEKYFSTGLDDVKYSGQICGFNGCMPVQSSVSSSHYSTTTTAITTSAYITDKQDHYVDMDDIQTCGSPLRLQ
jgi:CCR4-NOT transcription complex subunit 7/8